MHKNMKMLQVAFEFEINSVGVKKKDYTFY